MESNHQPQLSFITAIPVQHHLKSNLSILPRCKTLSSSPSSPLTTPSRTKQTTTRRCRPPPPCRMTASADVDNQKTGGADTSQDRGGSLDAILTPSDKRRYIFYGGKGGVGKTSTSAATAVKCAQSGMSTLIISTDPAHSLGDALQVDLSDGKMKRVSDDLELYAIESDPNESVEKVRKLLSSLNDNNTTDNNGGGWSNLINKLGLQELSDILQTIPPGADELIALSSVLDLINDEQQVDFKRIIIDTAPTGHTLRLLTFPDFLDNFLLQAMKLKQKLLNQKGIIGSVVNRVMITKEREESLNKAIQNISDYRDKMIKVSDLFRDPSVTEFIVVTIATNLAVSESKRLISKLWDDGIWVRHLVINQLLPSTSNDDDKAQKILQNYMNTMRKGQAKQIDFATEVLAKEHALNVSIVPRFDMEVFGLLGLDALSKVAFKQQYQAAYAKIFDESVATSKQCQFVFVGGKGGVGKTSMSASLGVALAKKGLKTLVLSTDPAHSLGDAFDKDLSDGQVQSVIGNSSNNNSTIDEMSGMMMNMDDLELYGLEINSELAIKEFQNLVDSYLSEEGGQNNSGMNMDMMKQLGVEEFAKLLNNAPPGIDELIALTQVMELIEYGDFERVIIDTAPTGHTLRLLSFPDFLDGFLDKVNKIKSKIDKFMSTFRTNDDASATSATTNKIEGFRENMAKLKTLITDQDRTQFVIVSVATMLAMLESERLVTSLKQDGVVVKNLIVNQVVPSDSTFKYVSRIVQQQERCITQLQEEYKEDSDTPLTIVKVPYFDVEVRGVYGLQAMAIPMFEQ